MSKTVAISEAQAWYRTAVRRLEALETRHAAFIIVAVAAIIYAQFQFWNQPSTGDRANWDYFAQVIARGGVPYRDVVNIKSPGSAYIGAAVIVATRPAGLRDVFAIRLAYLLLAALTVAFTFLVAKEFSDSGRIALLAAMILLAFNQFAKLNSGGVQPKTPMVLFGLVSLWAVMKDRPFMAGVFGMLSALCWQPGFLFVGAAGLAFSRYLTSWRDLRAARVIAGAAAALALMLAYFLAAGAARDFYLWNIHFNYTVYGPREVRTFSGFIDKLYRMISGPYRAERIYFVIGAIGLAAAAATELRHAIKHGARNLLDRAPRHSVLIAAFVYLMFCAVNIQGGADLIPLLPFVGIFAAVAIISLLDRASYFFARSRFRSDSLSFRRYGFIAISSLIFIFSVTDAFMVKRDFPTLADQEAEVREITSQLRPGDKIFVHGATEILVLSGLPNASKYFFMDRGKDTYLDVVEPGGFYGWFESLKAERPRIVALSRMEPVEHKEDFFNWVRSDYEMRTGRVFNYYVRKD